MQHTITHRREDHLDGRRHSCDGHRDGRRRLSDDDNDVTMCRDDLRRGCGGSGGGGGGSKKRNCSFSDSSSTAMANNRSIVSNRRRSSSEHHGMDPPITSYAPLDPPSSDGDSYSNSAVGSGTWKKSIYTHTVLPGASNATGASLKGKSADISLSTKSHAGAASPENDGGVTVSGTWNKSIYTPTLRAHPSTGSVRPLIEKSKAASTTATSSSSSSSSTTLSFCSHSTTTTESIIRRRRRASWDGRSKYYNRKKIVSFSEDRLVERGRGGRPQSTKFDTRRALVVDPKKKEQTPSSVNHGTLTHKSKMDNDVIKFTSFLTNKLLLPCMMLPVIIIRASTCKKKKDQDRMPPSLDASSCGSDDDEDDDSRTMKRWGTVTTYCSDESSSSSSSYDDDDSSGGDGRLITSYYHYSSTTIDDDGEEELERCKRDKKDYRDLVIRKRHGVVLVGKEKKDDEDVRSYYRDCIDELVYENESLCKYTLFL